jgi:hypothetical protein
MLEWFLAQDSSTEGRARKSIAMFSAYALERNLFGYMDSKVIQGTFP